MTGSNFLLESEGVKLLIDCGLTQSAHACEETNWSAFPYEVSAIDALLVTHAHIDHIGRIPRLVKEGFRGRIISTEATKALSLPLLEDAMELLEQEARRCKREPLYTHADIEKAFSLWEDTTYHKPQALPGGFSLEFLDAGHILGSAMIKLSRAGKSIVFTGDLGGGNSPLLGPTESVRGATYLVMESVYGDRIRREDTARRDQLENYIEETAARGGTLLIPAFSTERTQDLLYEIRGLMVEKRIPSMPVYADSPLATKITEAYLAHPQYFSAPIQERLAKGEQIFNFPELHFVADAAESRRIAGNAGVKIIIAGSGMSNGGRVLEHDKHVLPDKNSTLLIVGFQAAGSLGRRLIEGVKKVTLQGVELVVRCQVAAIYGYSAHMDGEALVEFVNDAREGLQHVFVVMGEPLAAGTLVQRIRDFLGVRASAPEQADKAEIEL